jgi:hypothetical protein
MKRRILSVLITAAIMITAIPLSASVEAFSREADITDVLDILKHLSNIQKATGERAVQLDLDRDTQITINDALVGLKGLAGITERPTVKYKPVKPEPPTDIPTDEPIVTTCSSCGECDCVCGMPTGCVVCTKSDCICNCIDCGNYDCVCGLVTTCSSCGECDCICGMTEPTPPTPEPIEGSIGFTVVGAARGWHNSICCCDIWENPFRGVAQNVEELEAITSGFSCYSTGWGVSAPVELNIDELCFENQVAIVLYSTYSSGAIRSIVDSLVVKENNLIINRVRTSPRCGITADIGFWQTVIMVDRKDFANIDNIDFSFKSITHCIMTTQTWGEWEWEACDGTCWKRENDWYNSWLERVKAPIAPIPDPAIDFKAEIVEARCMSYERLKNPIVVITSMKELTELFAHLHPAVHFMPCDFMINGISLFSKYYNTDFFDENHLVIINFKTSTCSGAFEVSEITQLTESSAKIHIKETKPNVANAYTAWFGVIEISKELSGLEFEMEFEWYGSN